MVRKNGMSQWVDDVDYKLTQLADEARWSQNKLTKADSPSKEAFEKLKNLQKKYSELSTNLKSGIGAYERKAAQAAAQQAQRRAQQEAVEQAQRVEQARRQAEAARKAEELRQAEAARQAAIRQAVKTKSV
jgi:peptidoglycan hydrolase CwlO-like protein